jgi:phosphoribosylpyrophosphate synthetase
MFNGLPFGPGVRVMTYEIHALQMMFYYQGHSGLTAHSAIPALLEEVRGSTITCIVFPDDGANKRFSGSFKGNFEIVVCAKQHVPGSTKKIVRVESGDPKGKHVLIVDDMTRSGGTLFECMQAVVRAGATKVSMFVTHADFTDEFWAALYVLRTGTGAAEFNAMFDAFYTTDSVSGMDSNSILQRLADSKDLYVSSIKKLIGSETRPFDKMKHDFEGKFDAMEVSSNEYETLEQWKTKLPALDSFVIMNKFKIISLAGSIVQDL